MALNLELAKHCTSLTRLSYLDGLMTRMTGAETEVWGLRADNFPEKLIPANSRNFLCYMGIAKEKLKASYGHVHFLTFGHENLLDRGEYSIEGILEHMYDIYCDFIRNEVESDDADVYLYPCQIDEESLAYWSEIAYTKWGIRDRPGLKSFIEHNELKGWVDWQALERDLPRVYHPSEIEYSSESESDTETDSDSDSDSDSESTTEEGEITDYESSDDSEDDEVTDYESSIEDEEPSRKRRKYVVDSEDEA